MKKVLAVFFLLFLVIGACSGLLLFTGKGMQIALRIAGQLTGGALNVEDATGRIGRAGTLTGLSYTDSDMALTVDRLSFSWHPLALFSGRLSIDGLQVSGLMMELREKEKVEAEATGSDYSLPDIVLPLVVDLRGIEFRDVRVSSNGESPVIIDQASLAMRSEEKSVVIEVLHVTAATFAVDLAGSVGLADGRSVGIEGEWWVKPPDFAELKGRCSLTGSLDQGSLQLELLSPFSARSVTDYTIAEALRFRSTLAAQKFNPELLHSDFPGTLNVDAVVTGTVAAGGIRAEVESLNIAGEVTNIPVDADARFSVVDDAVENLDLRVTSGRSRLAVVGRLGEELDATVELSSPDLGAFLPQAQGSVEVKGSVSGSSRRPILRGDIEASDLGSEGVTIASLQGTVDATLGEERELAATFELDDIARDRNHLDRLTISLAGELANHHLTLSAREQERRLELEAEGKFIDQRWSGELRDLVFYPGDEENFVQANPARLEVASGLAILDGFCAGYRGGSLCLTGEWQADEWHATARLSGFDPGVFVADWPGAVDGEVAGRGSFSGEDGFHRLEIVALSGTLRGASLRGGGSLTMENNGFSLEDFFLQMGESILSATGTVDDTFNVVFDGSVPDLAELVPESSGRITLSGSLQGDRLAPVVKLDIDAHETSFATVSIDAVTGRMAFDLDPNGQVSADVDLFGMQTGSLAVDEGNIRISGTTADHAGHLFLKTGEGDLRLQGRGAYTTTWKGVFDEVAFLSKDYGEWRNDGVAEAVFGSLEKSLNICLQGEKADFCVKAGLDGEEAWQADGAIGAFSLSLLNDFGFLAADIEGAVTGDFAVSGEGKVITRLEAQTTVADVVLSGSLNGEKLTYSIGKSIAQARLTEETVQLTLESQFQGESELNGIFVVTGVKDLSAGLTALPISGDGDFRVGDLDLITILTDSQVVPEGVLQGRFTLSGTIGRPGISGSVALQEGSVSLPWLGITVADLAVSVEAANDSLDFEYAGKSGGGELLGQGTLSFAGDGDWKVVTHATGNDFELVATEEYQIQADPDIHLELDREHGKLWGTLHIPLARIAPNEESDRITPSDDVIFVDDQATVRQEKRAFTTDIVITLGDNVQLDAYGLKSRLSGRLELKDEPGKFLTSLGELVVVDGKYSLYSTELDIDRGRLLFTGGPVDNPGVDFQGQRKVGTRVVGVSVGGTADNLEISLFSDPVMEESEILAYLLVGKSMYSSSDEQQSLIGAAARALGIGGANKIFGTLGEYIPIDEIYLDGGKDSEDMSLILGKKITEDLFVGYDHNFFNSSGDFRIRYTLGRGFSLETKSSASATSGEILYIFER